MLRLGIMNATDMVTAGIPPKARTRKRKIKYIPPYKNITKVLDTAKPAGKDYFLVVFYTIGRVREVNKLKWPDIRECATKLSCLE